MGHACSSDQVMPENLRVSPCPRHKMNPQRNCRACEEFMRSRRPEPRNNQFAPRVQQRYPPHMRGQMPPQQPPMGHQPFAQGRSMMPNQGPPHQMEQLRGGPVRPAQQLIGDRGRPTQQRMGGSGRPTPQMMGGPERPIQQMMGGPPRQMISQPPMGGPTPQMISQPPMGRPAPQMISQPPMGLPLGAPPQGVSVTMPAAQRPMIQGHAIRLPQQVMPPRVISQEVPMPTVIQAPAPPPCSTDVIVPQPQYEEILPAQKVVYEQVVMPMPKAVTAPAPPPCPTGTVVQELSAAPQISYPGSFPQQPMYGTIHPQHQQLRFKE